MKTLEEIEKTGFEKLELIASDTSVQVPPDLTRKLEDALLVRGVRRKRSSRRPWVYSISALTVAAAALALVLTLGGTPRDTFDDPAEAYAELENTLAYISSKMDRGMELASGIEPVIETASNAINRTK